jgi:hypothetical protein
VITNHCPSVVPKKLESSRPFEESHIRIVPSPLPETTC